MGEGVPSTGASVSAALLEGEALGVEGGCVVALGGNAVRSTCGSPFEQLLTTTDRVPIARRLRRVFGRADLAHIESGF